MSSLAELIQQRAALPDIENALDRGENPDDIEVIQVLEDLLVHDERWAASVLALGPISEAWERRRDADMAAFDAISAIEANDVVALKEAIDIMKRVGDIADVSMDDQSLLALAVRSRSDLDVFSILIGEGGADPGDFSADAWDALREMPEDPWRTAVEAMFGAATARVSGS